jgi:hypothetical protein
MAEDGERCTSRQGTWNGLQVFLNQRKTSIHLILEAQLHKKYAQITPLDDGVSSLFLLLLGKTFMEKKFKMVE